MPKLRIGKLNDIRGHLDAVLKNSLANLINPYQKELNSIQKDAIRLGKDLENLSLKIARDVTGQVQTGAKRIRRARKKLSAKAKKSIGAAQKKRWAEYRRKKKAKKTPTKSALPVHEIAGT